MKKEFLVERQGKTFALYAGLLDSAHEDGLKAIRTVLLQIPSADNGQVAICHAEVETAKGHFEGLGDASPENVARAMVPHLIRMAETRGKARALRDAINVGVTALEELSENDPILSEDDQAVPAPATTGRPAGQAAVPPATPHREGPAPARTPAPAAPITPPQLKAVFAIGKGTCHLSDEAIEDASRERFGVTPSHLTKAQASAFIDALKGGLRAPGAQAWAPARAS